MAIKLIQLPLTSSPRRVNYGRESAASSVLDESPHDRTMNRESFNRVSRLVDLSSRRDLKVSVAVLDFVDGKWQWLK